MQVLLESYDYSLWLILLGVSVAIIASRNLLQSLVYLAIFSLISACLYLTMQAPDVAITEAAIGAAISTIFFLVTLRSVGTDESSPRRLQFAALGVIVPIAILLFTTLPEIALYGAQNSPANLGSSKDYLAAAHSETGIPNIVTAVLGSYRSIDTLGEVFVILAAMLSVLLILPTKQEISRAKEKKNAS